MKSFPKSIYSALLALFFLSGCATFQDLDFFSKPTLDMSLPEVEDIKTLADVSSIGFEWKKISDVNIEGFAIFRAQSDGFFKKIATIRNPLATHFYDYNLTTSTTYSYQISTIGKNNTISRRSKTILAKTSFIDPIESLYASNDYPKMVKLLWNPHPNPSIKSYVIQREVNGKFKDIDTVENRLNIEYFDKDLNDGTEYRYRVAGVSFDGSRSKYSKVVSAKTKLPPAPVENLTTSKDLPKLIKLQWEASQNQDVNQYIVYSSDSANGRYKKITQTNKNIFEHKIDDDGAIRFYKVVAMDTDGIQGILPKQGVQGQTLAPPPTPINIKGFVENGKATIQWSIVNDPRVDGYVIYRKEGLFGTALKFTIEKNKSSFVDKEMSADKKYTYYVVSIDSNKIESKPSQEIQLALGAK